MSEETNWRPPEESRPQNTDLKLILCDLNREHQQSSIRVQWCVSRQLRDRLIREGIAAHLLLVVRDARGSERRHLVPLEQIQHRVDFHRAGPHSLYAFLVTGDFDGIADPRRIKIIYCTVNSIRRNGFVVYECVLLDEEGNPRKPKPGMYDGYAREELEIAEGFFAKEPPYWLQWFANLWHESPPMDQCQFRNRVIWALLLKSWIIPSWVVLISAIRFLVAAYMTFIIGIRGIAWHPILHPFANATRDIVETSKDSIFDPRDHWNTRKTDWTRARWLLPLMPLWPVLLIGLGMVGSIAMYVFDADAFRVEWGNGFYWGGGSYLALVGMIYTYNLANMAIRALGSALRRVSIGRWIAAPFVVAGGLIAAPVAWTFGRFLNWLATREAEQAVEHEEYRRQVYDVLACESREMRPVNPRTLPLAWNTRARLLFQETKAAVCKPFAR